LTIELFVHFVKEAKKLASERQRQQEMEAAIKKQINDQIALLENVMKQTEKEEKERRLLEEERQRIEAQKEALVSHRFHSPFISVECFDL
jgi:ribosome-binding ATPase YchF (GTP1/OBG family)